MKRKNSIWIYLLLIIGLVLMSAYSCNKDEEPTSNTITDIEGNIYHTVTIGTQVWMTENLRVSLCNDGTAIRLVSNSIQWSKLRTSAYCWFNNDKSGNKNIYGALYNGFSVDTRKLCPIGWHVPSDAEWTTLIDYLGGEIVAGGKLKETGIEHWSAPNEGATNESEFTALPGGYHNYKGIFAEMNNHGFFWSSSLSSDNGRYRLLNNRNSIVDRNLGIKSNGFSVRCIKD